MQYHQNSAGHGGRRCETARKTEIKIHGHHQDIKKNALKDVNILDRKNWRLAVSRATH